MVSGDSRGAFPEGEAELTDDGRATAFRDVGTGEPVVLIHGVGMNRNFWGPQVAELAGSRRVVTYDMLGHGRSAMAPEGAVIDDYVAQLRDLMDALSIPAANLVGHSMGALVALGFALSSPSRALRLAALNAVYERTPEQRSAVLARANEIAEKGAVGSADGTIARWFDAATAERIPGTLDAVRGWLESVDPIGYARAYRVFATSDRCFAGKLHELAMPSLFLTGDMDLNSTPAMSERMAAESGDGKAVSLPGERHMMSLVDPVAVNAVLREFLSCATCRA